MKKHVRLSLLCFCLVALAALALLNATGQPVFHPGKSLTRETSDFRRQLPQLLRESWAFYKGRFLVDGAHVVSNNYGGTISEGQSYALLKAFWMDDPQTFERVWRWTKTHMARPNDALLGWRWGDRPDGTQGLLEIENASDADQDIAYALLLAGERWQRPDYAADGRAIVQDLWRLDVQEIGGRLYLVPGTWKGFRQEYLTIDPSYMAPYVYRRFAEADPAHAQGWRKLADDVYDALEACTNLTVPHLPPNWCAVRYDDAPGSNALDDGPRIVFSDRQGEGARDFSYDAFRVYWRMAMDAALSPPPGRDRARVYLENHRFLLDYWQTHHIMPEGFTPDGQPRGTDTSGFAMGPLLVLHSFSGAPKTATGALYAETLAPHYNARGYWFNDYNDYLHSVIWLHLYALSLHEI